MQTALVTRDVFADYTMIRQPYRITMAKWDYTAVQKRILTMIISRLQKEIALLEKGLPVGQLDLFNSDTNSVTLTFQLNDLVLNSNNYAHVKKALQQLRSIDVEIVLPATVSRKSKMPEQQTVITGLIERAEILKHSRTITVFMHKATAMELIKISNGLTVYAQDVMYLTNNSHTQRIYEILSHWKDQEVFSLTVEKFRERLCIDNKYPHIADLIRYVIKPAEKELKEIGDIFFEFSTTKVASKIAKFNFIIKHRKTVKIDDRKIMLLKEEISNLLRIHFGFKPDHFEAIKGVLSRTDILEPLKYKLVDLHSYIKEAKASPKTEIKRVPEYVLTCLLAEFKS